MAFVRCDAKAKSTGNQCQRPTVNGSKKCRYHGGLSPRGLASPQIRTGRYSKHLPTRMLERYELAATDPGLLSLREEIQIIDARLADVLTRVDTGESGVLWSQARSLWKEFRAEPRDSSEALAIELKLDECLGRGVADWSAWSEIHKLLNQRKALVESERKALLDAHNAMTIDQGMVMVEALIQTVRAHVKDPAALAGISADLGRILGRAPDRRDKAE